MTYYTVCNQLNLIEDDIIKSCNIDYMLDYLENNPISIKYNAINKFINLDTETEGSFDFVNKLLSIQLGNNDTFFFIAYQYLTESEKVKLQNWINTSKYIFIAHNSKFDLKFLRLNKMNPYNVYCTLTIEKICYGGIAKEKGFYSLEQLCIRYFNVQLDKNIRGKINRTTINDSQVIYYALDDIKYLFKIVEKQLEYLATITEYPQFNYNDITDIYRIVGLENATTLALAECEMVGFGLNPDALSNVSIILNKEFNALLDKIKEEVTNCNILSNILLTNTLFGIDYRLMPSKTKPKTFSWTSPTQKLWALRHIVPELMSTKSEVLYEHQTKHPIIPLLLEYNKLFKLKTSFVDALPKQVNRVTGRVHTKFNQVLNTGRMSCKEPNLMQTPSKGELGIALRACFWETGNYSLVGGDWSGCELGIIANNSEDTLWLNAINNGEDLHGILASKTFNIPFENIRNKTPFNKDMTYRDVQKTIDFMLAYGGSEFKLAIVMKVVVEYAKSIIDSFFKIVPKVKKYLDSIGRFGKNNYFCVTNPPYFRIRRFDLDTSAGSRTRASKNTPIQGTNADMIKLAMVKVFRFNKDPRIKLILPVHDELITRCPDDLAGYWKDKLKEIMEEVAKFSAPKVNIPADVKISKIWKK